MNPDLLIPTLVNDAVRYSHLLAIAVGLGASFLADVSVYQKLSKPISQTLLDTLHTCHRVVWLALAAMWISGLVLIYMRTGFVPENFSPKLQTKIVVVCVLTLNAVLIGKFALPHLIDRLGRRALDMPLKLKLPLACMAGVSTLSWLFALALGSSRFLAQANAELFYALISVAYGGCILVALGTAVTVHRAQRPEDILTPSATVK